MADQCEDRDERIECAVPLEPCQKQYGRRFEQPYSDSTAFDGDCGACGCRCYMRLIDGTDPPQYETRCGQQPPGICTQVDENKPLPVPNSDIEKEGCEDIMGQFALDVMGYKPPRNARILADPEGLLWSSLSVLTGHMVKPIEPSATLDSIPVMKGEVTKKMCSLKDYSFTIGD